MANTPAASVTPRVTRTVRSSTMTGSGWGCSRLTATGRHCQRVGRRRRGGPLHCPSDVAPVPPRLPGPGVPPADAHLLLARVRGASPPRGRAGLPVHPPPAAGRLPARLPRRRRGRHPLRLPPAGLPACSNLLVRPFGLLRALRYWLDPRRLAEGPGEVPRPARVCGAPGGPLPAARGHAHPCPLVRAGGPAGGVRPAARRAGVLADAAQPARGPRPAPAAEVAIRPVRHRGHAAIT